MTVEGFVVAWLVGWAMSYLVPVRTMGRVLAEAWLIVQDEYRRWRRTRRRW